MILNGRSGSLYYSSYKASKLDSGFLYTLYISLGNVAVILQHTNTLSISELLLLQIVMAFCMLDTLAFLS